MSQPKSPTTTLSAIAEEMAKALEKMIEYSHFHEGWQDDHPEYPKAAGEAMQKYTDWRKANELELQSA